MLPLIVSRYLSASATLTSLSKQVLLDTAAAQGSVVEQCTGEFLFRRLVQLLQLAVISLNDIVQILDLSMYSVLRASACGLQF